MKLDQTIYTTLVLMNFIAVAFCEGVIRNSLLPVKHSVDRFQSREANRVPSNTNPIVYGQIQNDATYADDDPLSAEVERINEDFLKYAPSEESSTVPATLDPELALLEEMKKRRLKQVAKKLKLQLGLTDTVPDIKPAITLEQLPTEVREKLVDTPPRQKKWKRVENPVKPRMVLQYADEGFDPRCSEVSRTYDFPTACFRFGAPPTDEYVNLEPSNVEFWVFTGEEITIEEARTRIVIASPLKYARRNNSMELIPKQYLRAKVTADGWYLVNFTHSRNVKHFDRSLHPYIYIHVGCKNCRYRPDRLPFDLSARRRPFVVTSFAEIVDDRRRSRRNVGDTLPCRVIDFVVTREELGLSPVYVEQPTEWPLNLCVGSCPPDNGMRRYTHTYHYGRVRSASRSQDAPDSRLSKIVQTSECCTPSVYGPVSVIRHNYTSDGVLDQTISEELFNVTITQCLCEQCTCN